MGANREGRTPRKSEPGSNATRRQQQVQEALKGLEKNEHDMWLLFEAQRVGMAEGMRAPEPGKQKSHPTR